jgi:hypothetical protein
MLMLLVLAQMYDLGNVPETDQSLADPSMASSAAVPLGRLFLVVRDVTSTLNANDPSGSVAAADRNAQANIPSNISQEAVLAVPQR